jgi:uncharacterized cupredoxin-like copper-binding protein
VIRRLLLIAALLGPAACGEDNPTIIQPQGQESPAEEPASGDIEVAAVEYKFHGVPAAVSEGEHTFVLQNEGEEPHELYLFHIPGEETLEELLALNEKEVSKVTQAVDRAEAKPGGSAKFTAALVPGRFGYVCFVTTEEGEPHAFLGMVGEFTVA